MPMPESEHPFNQSDSEKDTTNDIQLTPEEQALFDQFITEVDSSNDPVVEILTGLSDSKNQLLKAVSEAAEADFLDPSQMLDIQKQVNIPATRYVQSLEKLPSVLKLADTPKEEAVDTMAEQYKQMDTTLVDRLAELTGDDTMFRKAPYESIRQSIKEIYDLDEIEIEQIGHTIAQTLANSVSSDLGKYFHLMSAKARTAANESLETKIDTILDNSQAIVEELNEARSQSLKQRIGKHALDVAKITAGSAIGFMVAKRFSR